MKVILNIVKELWGLFVDDQSYALAILVWVGISAFAIQLAPVTLWAGPLLFIGLGLVLLENVVRSVRKMPRRNR
jgi:membrane protein implicated in regulation of membrane protease activity